MKYFVISVQKDSGFNTKNAIVHGFGNDEKRAKFYYEHIKKSSASNWETKLVVEVE